MAAILLDTCAVIYVANDLSISREARSTLHRALRRQEVFVSPMSAWEVGLLGSKQRFQFFPDAKTWFFDFVEREAVSIAALLPEIMIDAWSLPQPLHADPADRIIITTARHLGAAIMTRDRRILDYAERGNVGAVAC